MAHLSARLAARRMQAVQAPIIPEIGALIRAHPGTLSLGQGVAYYAPPDGILTAVTAAMEDPAAHLYGYVDGIPALVDALAQKLRQDNGIDVDEGGGVVVTAGANMGFIEVLLAIADPGDEVILLAPYYFNHEMACGIAGCRAVVVPTDEAYQPRLDLIRGSITRRTRAVVTVSPNNPTGAVYDEALLREINALCSEQGIFHVSDEAYEYFTYEDSHHFSPASIPGSSPHTISLFSFSKSYGMAGWRMGYMMVPELLVGAVRKIQDTNLICPPIPSQHAALAALAEGPSYCRRHLAPLSEVRRIALVELASLGDRVTVPPVQGAFYLFPRVRTQMEPMVLCRRLVEEYGVAVLPGATFGADDGCFLRISYGALRKETAVEAVGRLVEGLRDFSR